MNMTVFFFTVAACLLAICAWGLTWRFILKRLRRARHRRAIARRHLLIPRKDIDSAHRTGMFSVGRDVKTIGYRIGAHK